jgi:hypothetical protein
MELCIRVCDANAQDAIGTSCPKSLKQQVTSFIFSSCGFFINVLVGNFVGQSLHVLIGATVDEEGFVACCRGGEGSGGQIHQFISDFSDLIVPKSHETSFLASERMLKREMGVTAVALVGEVINASHLPWSTWCSDRQMRQSNI